MFYLLMSTEEELNSTFFFFSDGIHPSVRAKLPNHAYIPVVWIRRNALLKVPFLLYLILLRLTAKIRWPFLKTAKIFAMDQLRYAGTLIGRRKYTHLADGPNCFRNLKTTPDYRITVSPANKKWYMRVTRLFLGECWHRAYAANPYCEAIVSTTPDRLEFQKGKKSTVYSLTDLWNAANQGKRNRVLSVFDITEEDCLNMKKRSVILLTQQLATEGTVTEEELAKIYADLLKPFPPESILIKRHPRDRVDYKKYFPQALLYDKFAPMQLFAIMGVSFKTAVTLFSSSVTSFPGAEVVWGGSELHPRIKAKYGKQVLHS